MRLSISCLTMCGLAFALAACGAQLTYAPHTAGPSFATLDVGGRVVQPRANGAYMSTDLVVGWHDDKPFSLRHVLAGSGYRLLLSPVSFEIGAELGAGQPASRSWDGTGLYVGGLGAILLRISGHQDRETGYAPVAVLTDLVLQSRLGLWNPPAGDSGLERADATLEIGFRISGVSDFPVSTNRNWKP